jgi:uncharacterized membrane protein
VEIDYLGILFRWLHIVPAIVAVGGTIFMRMALVPAAAGLPDAARPAFHEAVRSHWARWVHAAILFLLVSGFYNFFTLNARYKLPLPAYHILFSVKLLLALAIFAIASLLSGRTAVAQRMRQNAPTWLNLNIALAVLLICISGVMRSITMSSPLKSGAPAAAPVAAPVE